MNYKILLIAALCLQTTRLQAQTVKQVTVSAHDDFTDNLTLQQDYKDTGLTVNFAFNEADNVLTLTLNSYRNILVFQDDVRYSQVIHRKQLRPERFPYVVPVEKKQHFRLNSSFKKTVKKPRKKQVFRRWISQEGLIPRPTEYKIVNDTLVQKFEVMNSQNTVSITLRDVILMGREAKHEKTWWLICAKDCDTRYEITIQRDPCFGLENDLQTASQNLSDLQKSYNIIYSNFGSGKVSSPEALALFQKSQSILLQQFPRHTSSSECPSLQDTWNQYNQLVDSISRMTCTVETSGGAAMDLLPAESAGIVNMDLISLSSRARQIDEMVSRWMITTDETERRDLIRQCEKSIKEGNELIRMRGPQNEEQQRAIRTFRSAERYYHTTIRK